MCSPESSEVFFSLPFSRSRKAFAFAVCSLVGGLWLGVPLRCRRAAFRRLLCIRLLEGIRVFCWICSLLPVIVPAEMCLGLWGCRLSMLPGSRASDCTPCLPMMFIGHLPLGKRLHNSGALGFMASWMVIFGGAVRLRSSRSRRAAFSSSQTQMRKQGRVERLGIPVVIYPLQPLGPAWMLRFFDVPSELATVPDRPLGGVGGPVDGE